jgi:DNA-binding LacI/PurR family transcriptional regulator
MAKKSITSYDVATKAGVSQSAVSRAFSPTASIAEKTRKHILSVAQEMGFQPNAFARNMSISRKEGNPKSGMVGVIVSRVEDPVFAQMIALISSSFQAHGWQMLLFTVDTVAEVDDALNSLMRYKIDGAMILSAILSNHMANVCQKQGIPVLLYNREPAGLEVNTVQIENHEGGRIAAEILCEAGHQRIAFVGGETGDATSMARMAGLVEYMSEVGHELFQLENGDYTFNSGREAGLRLFSRREKPDAVFCASDVMALGVMHAAHYELGLSIPKDFSLIGFDDIPAAAWPGHMLTTIRQPIRRMIQEAVEVLVECIADPRNGPRVRQFSGTLILRDTVRQIMRK